MALGVDLSILNQRGTPAFFSDIFANRPAFGFAGRVFISTDTGAIYEDTGTAWTLIADAGAGTTGTLQQVTTNGNTTTQGISITAGGLSSNSITNTSLTTGSVAFVGAAGLMTQDNANFFWDDTNNRLGIGTATPGTKLDIHGTGTMATFNGTTTNNGYIGFQNAGVSKWLIGNTYSAGANNYDIYNSNLATNALSFLGTTSAATFASSVTSTRFILSGATSPTGLYYDSASNRVTVANYTSAGVVTIEVNTGATAATFNANLSTTFAGAISGTSASFSSTGSFGGGTNGGATFAINNGGAEAKQTFAGFSSNLNLTQSYNTSTNVYVTDEYRAASYSFKIGTTDAFIIASSGAATLSNLAGTGSRAVLADANGLLSAPVSDITVKENIKPIEYGLSEILKMKPVWFDFIDEYKNYGQGRQNGNIAQDMQQIIPEAIFTTPSTNKMGINYDQLHAIYIKAIQELNDKIEKL